MSSVHLFIKETSKLESRDLMKEFSKTFLENGGAKFLILIRMFIYFTNFLKFLTLILTNYLTNNFQKSIES